MYHHQFRNRTLELLDADDIPSADLYQNLKELDFINTYLGGHAITIAGVKKIIAAHPEKRTWTVLDIACGGGDNINALKKWALRNHIDIQFFGLDLKEVCVDYSKARLGDEVTIYQMDFKDLENQDMQFDICTAALFAHHLFDEDLEYLLGIMHRKSNYGYVINDLHRNPIAYHSIKWLTYWFSKSYLVKNDACLSVARGFKKRELQAALQKAEVGKHKIYWRWAFRWLVVGFN